MIPEELESTETTLSEQIFPVLEVLELTFESADLEADEKLGIKNSGLLILKIITLLTTHLPTSSVYAGQVSVYFSQVFPDLIQRFCFRYWIG